MRLGQEGLLVGMAGLVGRPSVGRLGGEAGHQARSGGLDDGFDLDGDTEG